MANNPITQRVKAAFSKLTFPANQEVTLNADGTGGPIISPSGHVGKAPSCGCGSKTCKCGKSPNKMGCGSPAKQTKNPRFTDKLYEKAEVIKDKMKNLEKDAFISSNYSSEGYEESKGERKAQRKLKRLGKKLTRVEKREKKKRAKYNY